MLQTRAGVTAALRFRYTGGMRTLLALLAILLPPIGASAADLAGVACVHDGDTLRLDARRRGDACQGGTSVRIKGIAAPELVEPGGVAARNGLKAIAEGRRVTCWPTGEKSGDRVIAFCEVAGRDIGAAMVAGGLARDCPRWSDGRYAAAERASGDRLAASYKLPGYCELRR